MIETRYMVNIEIDCDIRYWDEITEEVWRVFLEKDHKTYTVVGIARQAVLEAMKSICDFETDGYGQFVSFYTKTMFAAIAMERYFKDVIKYYCKGEYNDYLE